MSGLSRRSVLRSSLALAATGTLARPYIANAAATTAEVWWPQGFVPLSNYCYNRVEKKRSYYGVPTTQGCLPNHIWRPLIEKAGYTLEDIPKTWDAFYDFFKEVQKKLRAQGVRNVYGLGFQFSHHRRRLQRRDQRLPGPLWRSGHRHQGRQTAPRRRAGARSGDQDADLSDHRLQGRLCAAGGDQLERFRRQQRLPRQADRHGYRGFAVDRDGHHQEPAGLQRHRRDGPGAQQRRQAGTGPARKPLRPDPEGGKKRRGGQGLPQIFDPAESPARVSEAGAGPLSRGDAGDREERPVVARLQGSAPAGLRPSGLVRPDRADLLDLQPGLCPGPERACLADGLGRDHSGQGNAAGRGREGVQAGRGDLREIPDHANLNRVPPPAHSRNAFAGRAGLKRVGHGAADVGSLMLFAGWRVEEQAYGAPYDGYLPFPMALLREV